MPPPPAAIDLATYLLLVAPRAAGPGVPTSIDLATYLLLVSGAASVVAAGPPVPSGLDSRIVVMPGSPAPRWATVRPL
jgi:hypothetical protein